MISAIGAPANERAGNRQAEILDHRVTSLLYSWRRKYLIHKHPA